MAQKKLNKRGNVLLGDWNACYRVPSVYSVPLPAKEDSVLWGLILPVYSSQGYSSLRKCERDSKNTERIFVTGDYVQIVAPHDIDLANASGNVWIIVKKQRDDKVRTWKRPLQEVMSHVSGLKQEFLECPIWKWGSVRSTTQKKQPDTDVFAISLDGKTLLWVEAGLFQEVYVPI